MSASPSLPAHDDARCIARALAGDERAYSELLARYRSRVLGLALRMVQNADDASDIAQEAFIRAFQSLSTFDVTKSFGAWIAKITANLCIDHFRRRRLSLISLDAPIEAERGDRAREYPDAGPIADEIIGRSEAEKRLDAHIASLPPGYRVVVILRYKEDLAYEEIAGVLGIPLGTVKARLHRAHHLLKRRLLASGLVSG
jgi:RNA polymerase sigma-70 factor (ECF subfamily)